MSEFSFKRGGGGSNRDLPLGKELVPRVDSVHCSTGRCRRRVRSQRRQRACRHVLKESSLSGLFDGMDPNPAPPPSSPPHHRPLLSARLSVEARPAPPSGHVSCGRTVPEAEPDELAGLTTRDKERVQQLRAELTRLKTSNYFEYFQLNHESPDASLKKAYFSPQSATTQTPSWMSRSLQVPSPGALWALLRGLGGSVGCWQRKHIFGEKDENDLAMEQVQRVLDAEASFKQGTRLLNAGKPVDALRHFKAAHEAYEEEGVPRLLWADASKDKSKSQPETADRAMAMLHQAAKLSPNSTKPSHFLGKAYLLRGARCRQNTSVRSSSGMRTTPKPSETTGGPTS